jgi:hypothetical protein
MQMAVYGFPRIKALGIPLNRVKRQLLKVGPTSSARYGCLPLALL